MNCFQSFLFLYCFHRWGLKQQNWQLRLQFSQQKEGTILVNDALNIFYLRLYGVRHMVKDHSDSERGNPLPPHRLLFPISSKGSFICIIPDRIIHTTAFVTPVVEHWLERIKAQWVHPMKDRSDDPRSYISLPAHGGYHLCGRICSTDANTWYHHYCSDL